jgi:hypothetical protein
MDDFRTSPQYKIFTSCRVNNDKYDAALSTFEKSDLKDLSAAKRVSIEAMAYNESCLISAKKVTVTASSVGLKAQGSAAMNSFAARVATQNQVLSGIITNQTSKLALNTENYLKATSIENSRFSRLDSYVESNGAGAVSIWIYVALAAAALLALRGYLRLPKEAAGVSNKTPGLIKQSFGFFRVIYEGLKSEYSTIKKGINSKKDNDNV